MTVREDFPPVQHFIILQRGRKVALEDSDLQFDNIVSLTFHYTQVWWVYFTAILLYLSVREKCPSSFGPCSAITDEQVRRHAKHLANQHLMSPISSSITACLSQTRHEKAACPIDSCTEITSHINWKYKKKSKRSYKIFNSLRAETIM